MVAQHAEIVIYHIQLAQCHNKTASEQSELGKDDEALESWKTAMDIYEKLVRDHPELGGCRTDLAGVCANIGQLQSLRGQQDEAKAWLQRALEISEKRHEETSSQLQRDQLAFVRTKLGEVARRGGDDDGAREHYVRAMQILLANPDATRNKLEWELMGHVFYRLGRWEESRTALEKLTSMLGEDAPTLAEGTHWWYLAMVAAQLGDRERAQSIYTQLAAQHKYLVSICQQTLRAEAAQLLAIEIAEDVPEQ